MLGLLGGSNLDLVRLGRAQEGDTVADWVRVVPEDLHLSASEVADHADDLQARTAAIGMPAIRHSITSAALSTDKQR
jgi:hypothetical protein